MAQVRPRVHVVDRRGQVITGWTGGGIGHGWGIAFNSPLTAAGNLVAIYYSS